MKKRRTHMADVTPEFKHQPHQYQDGALQETLKPQLTITLTAQGKAGARSLQADTREDQGLDASLPFSLTRHPRPQFLPW